MVNSKSPNDPIETPPAAAAFLEYCYLGPERSLAKLATYLNEKKWQTNGKKTVYIRQLEIWSSKYSWVSRAKAYDAEQITKEATERKAKLDAEIDAMNARQAMIGTTQQSRALKQIEALIEAQKFGSQASVALLKLAIEVEREARGASIERIEITGKDGAAIETSNSIAIYLPAKDPEV